MENLSEDAQIILRKFKDYFGPELRPGSSLNVNTLLPLVESEHWENTILELVKLDFVTLNEDRRNGFISVTQNALDYINSNF